MTCQVCAEVVGEAAVRLHERVHEVEAAWRKRNPLRAVPAPFPTSSQDAREADD